MTVFLERSCCELPRLSFHGVERRYITVKHAHVKSWKTSIAMPTIAMPTIAMPIVFKIL